MSATQRVYEVVEKSTAYRTYFVVADSADAARRKVRAGENENDPRNWCTDGDDPCIVSVKWLRTESE